MAQNKDTFGESDLQYVHVAIGGIGTAVGDEGYDLTSTVAWAAGANVTHPNLVIKAHSKFIECGADLLITNTYQANIKRLSEKMPQNEAIQYVTSGVKLAQKAIQQSEKEKSVQLVGCIGPYATYLNDCSEYTGSYMENKDFDRELLRQNYIQQAQALFDAGIRLFDFETIPSLEETFYAKEVLEKFDCDGWVSVICKDSEHLVNGDKFCDVVKSLSNSKRVKAIGINCTSPLFIKGLLEKGSPYLNGKYFVVYPNSGELFDKEKNEFYGPVLVDQILNELEDWVKLGLRIIGGCCRIKYPEVERIAQKVREINGKIKGN